MVILKAAGGEEQWISLTFISTMLLRLIKTHQIQQGWPCFVCVGV